MNWCQYFISELFLFLFDKFYLYVQSTMYFMFSFNVSISFKRKGQLDCYIRTFFSREET